MTAQQARDYNMLLEIKERVESKYKDKNRINIINKKPRIIFMSNIEENKISDEAKQRAKNYMSLKGALEPKQETLEEAMRRNGYHDEVNDTLWREGVLFGAKWQQERMYSEEDMIEFAGWAVRRDWKDVSSVFEKSTKELFQLWKEQKPKTLYYE